ncbi:hypothetical protein DDD_1382 [Nonlabens dokdonensis DSW-6]|uniref:Uncharacterized protein n=1 Tax=Nonlabens dokdonensis (strain DSM 17205 / KCTC 12402 / DSW-6) TaxID=592029 RepID=L7W8M8_NONDD|nr:hypothetical protein DDD_1382 [Nonlabens dokdonensis DSW-6]
MKKKCQSELVEDGIYIFSSCSDSWDKFRSGGCDASFKEEKMLSLDM